MPRGDLGGYPAELRDRNLRKGQRTRVLRGELKRQLRKGNVDPWRLLRGSDEEWESVFQRMRIQEALEAIPGVGPVTTLDACAELRLDPSLRVDALTYERRAQIAADLKAAVEHGITAPRRPLEAT